MTYLGYLEQIATCILDVSKEIFEINEKNNPQTIFKDKTFIINDGKITMERCNSEESTYYFEHPEINGVITKNEDGDYSIKATVQYINSKGEKWEFAKIRVYDYFGEIRISGRRTGSWEMHDINDEDFLKNPDFELPLVLDAMNSGLHNMYDNISKNVELGGNKYVSQDVKQLIKYNKKIN